MTSLNRAKVITVLFGGTEALIVGSEADDYVSESYLYSYWRDNEIEAFKDRQRYDYWEGIVENRINKDESRYERIHRLHKARTINDFNLIAFQNRNYLGQLFIHGDLEGNKDKFWFFGRHIMSICERILILHIEGEEINDLNSIVTFKKNWCYYRKPMTEYEEAINKGLDPKLGILSVKIDNKRIKDHSIKEVKVTKECRDCSPMIDFKNEIKGKIMKEQYYIGVSSLDSHLKFLLVKPVEDHLVEGMYLVPKVIEINRAGRR